MKQIGQCLVLNVEKKSYILYVRSQEYKYTYSDGHKYKDIKRYFNHVFTNPFSYKQNTERLHLL